MPYFDLVHDRDKGEPSKDTIECICTIRQDSTDDTMEGIWLTVYATNGITMETITKLLPEYQWINPLANGHAYPHKYIHTLNIPTGVHLPSADYLKKYHGLSSGNEVNHHAHYLLTDNPNDRREKELFNGVQKKLAGLCNRNTPPWKDDSSSEEC